MWEIWLYMSTITLQGDERTLHFALRSQRKYFLCLPQCESDLAVHDIELESTATLHFDSLFKVKNPEFGPALEFILHHCRRKLWPPYNLEKQNEQGVMIEICSQIFSTSLH